MLKAGLNSFGDLGDAFHRSYKRPPRAFIIIAGRINVFHPLGLQDAGPSINIPYGSLMQGQPIGAFDTRKPALSATMVVARAKIK